MKPVWGRERFALALAASAMLLAGAISIRALESPLAPRAPERLADTGLYAPGRPGVVDSRNRPFSPQYPLWSDGAAKARWVYLPDGAAIDTSNVAAWDFPVGTKFWKEFSFAGRKVETRLLWKAGPGRWVLASYVWNGEGTDAVLAPDSGVPDVVDVAPGRRHSIPSVADCRACHESRRVEVLGFNALQLSTDRDPNAVHGELLTDEMITVRTLVEESRLSPPRPELVSSPPRIDASTPAERRLAASSSHSLRVVA